MDNRPAGLSDFLWALVIMVVLMTIIVGCELVVIKATGMWHL